MLLFIGNTKVAKALSRKAHSLRMKIVEMNRFVAILELILIFAHVPSDMTGY